MTIQLTRLSAPANLRYTSQNTSTGLLSGGATYYIRVAAQTAGTGSYYYFIFQRPSNWIYELTSPVTNYITAAVGSSDNSLLIEWDAVGSVTFLDGTTRDIRYLLWVTDKDPATYGQAAWDTAYIKSIYNGSCEWPTTKNTSYTFEDDSVRCNTKIHNSQRHYDLPGNLDPLYTGEQPTLEIHNETTNLTHYDLAIYLTSDFGYADQSMFATVANIVLTDYTGTIDLTHINTHFYRCQITSNGAGEVHFSYGRVSYVGFYRRQQQPGFKYYWSMLDGVTTKNYPVENYLVNSSSTIYSSVGAEFTKTPVYGNFAMTGQGGLLDDLIIASVRQWYSYDAMQIQNSYIRNCLYFDISLPPSKYGWNAYTDFIYKNLTIETSPGNPHLYLICRGAEILSTKDERYENAINENLLPFTDCDFIRTDGTTEVVDGVENVPRMHLYGSYAERIYWHAAVIYTIKLYVTDEGNNPIENATIEFMPSQDSRWKISTGGTEPNTTGVTDSNGYSEILLRKLVTSQYDYTADSYYSSPYVMRFFPFRVRVYKQGYELYEMTDYEPKKGDTLYVTLKRHIKGVGYDL